MLIPHSKAFYGFSMIVDINGFTSMIENADGNSSAQFVRDALSGGIEVVEKYGGEVVGFMGDSFLAICDCSENVFMTCLGIAKDVDRTCEYISNEQKNNPNVFEFAPGGFSVKIGVEYGLIDISEIRSNYLSEQKLFISPAINYASRIIVDGLGNRCFIGPKAINNGLDAHMNRGPFTVKGKHNEPDYIYYELVLDDIWRTEGSNETYWG